MKISKSQTGGLRIVFHVDEMKALSELGWTLGEERISASLEDSNTRISIVKNLSGNIGQVLEVGGNNAHADGDRFIITLGRQGQISGIPNFGTTLTNFEFSANEILIEMPPLPQLFVAKAPLAVPAKSPPPTPSVEPTEELLSAIERINKLKDQVQGLDLSIDGKGYLQAHLTQSFGRQS